MYLKLFFIFLTVIVLHGCTAFQQTKGDVDNGIKSTHATPPLLQFELPFNKQRGMFLPLNSKDKVVLDILKQGAYYASLKDPSRLMACKELATIYKEDAFWQAGWLLAYSFSDKGSCITHKERLVLLNELEGLVGFHEYKDIQWLNSVNIQTLEHINYLKARNVFLKEKVRALEETLQERQAENTELKILIKELKTVEKIMNERISDGSP